MAVTFQISVLYQCNKDFIPSIFELRSMVNLYYRKVKSQLSSFDQQWRRFHWQKLKANSWRIQVTSIGGIGLLHTKVFFVLHGLGDSLLSPMSVLWAITDNAVQCIDVGNKDLHIPPFYIWRTLCIYVHRISFWCQVGQYTVSQSTVLGSCVGL